MTLRKDEMDQLRRIHDYELNLPERWFTGTEWSDGTAAKVLAEDYRNALIEAGYEAPREWQLELLVNLVAKQISDDEDEGTR